jgi:transcriptional regulator with XRE-family HTH domain
VAALAEQRRAAQLSQTEVAARMGTSQSSVARLEAGEVDPRLSTLDRYAEALGGQLEVGVRFGSGPVAAPGPSPFPVTPALHDLPGAGGLPAPGTGRPQLSPAARLDSHDRRW